MAGLLRLMTNNEMAWIAKLGSRRIDNERLIYSPPAHPNSLSCVMQRRDWRINTALPGRITSTRYSHQSCPTAPIWGSEETERRGPPFTVFLLLNDAAGTFVISAQYSLFTCLLILGNELSSCYGIKCTACNLTGRASNC